MKDGDVYSPLWLRTRHFVAGYFSGVCLVMAGHPFDTIKVRLQYEGIQGRFRGPLHCTWNTLRHEGVYGLYKGVTPPLFMFGIINSILFGLQGLFLEYFTGSSDPNKASIFKVMQSAVFGGLICGSLVVTPVEGIKSRLQVQYHKKYIMKIPNSSLYTGPIDCIRKVYQKLGLFHGIYRGCCPTTLCRMTYFGSYAFFRRFLHKKDHNSSSNLFKKFSDSIIAGGLAGICYWFSCFPIDVVKAKIQASPDTIPPKYRSMFHCINSIYKLDGLKGFFRGFTPCLLRAFPANASAFIGYELMMYILPISK